MMNLVPPPEEQDMTHGALVMGELDGLFELGTPGAVHEVFLPYTSPPLSMNDRWAHWGQERKAQREVSKAASVVIRAAGWPEMFRIDVALVWYRGTNAHADSDNIVATIKPCIDALKPRDPQKNRPWGLGLVREDYSRVVRNVAGRVVTRDEDPHPKLGARLLLVVREV
jgi:hypothetical protein